MEKKRLMKLTVLRMLLIITLTIAEVVCLIVKGPLEAYRYPVKWLNHYLKGSGKPIKVPAELVQQARMALLVAIKKDDYRQTDKKWRKVYGCELEFKDFLRGKYCVSHSTLYEGRGFYGRPSLFYVMGGFSFNVYKKDNKYIVSGKDFYDWHPTREGKYFTSPLGRNKIMLSIVKVLGHIFGDDLFVTNGWPMGEAGISNKLWDKMHQVGAKAFYSYFENIDLNITPYEEYCLIFDKRFDDYNYEPSEYELLSEDEFWEIAFDDFWNNVDWGEGYYEQFDAIQHEWVASKKKMPLEAYIYENYKHLLKH